jgi:hypothetical protein
MPHIQCVINLIIAAGNSRPGDAKPASVPLGGFSSHIFLAESGGYD